MHALKRLVCITAAILHMVMDVSAVHFIWTLLESAFLDRHTFDCRPQVWYTLQYFFAKNQPFRQKGDSLKSKDTNLSH